VFSEPNAASFAKTHYQIDVSSYDNGAAAALEDLGPAVQKGLRAGYRIPPKSDFAVIMRQRGGDTVTLHEIPRMSEKDKELIKYIPPGGNYLDVPDHAATVRIRNFKRTGGRTTTYGRLHPSRPSYTINTQFRRPNVGSNFHYAEPRLITAREALRLQSFPDYVDIQGCANEQRNTLIGNAVPPLLAQALAWKLMEVISGANRQAFCLEG
jgi:DNA (cytosine-5)-methyltransferase 1